MRSGSYRGLGPSGQDYVSMIFRYVVQVLRQNVMSLLLCTSYAGNRFYHEVRSMYEHFVLV